MKAIKFLLVILVLTLILSCNKDESVCDQDVIISKEQFDIAPNDNHVINNTFIDGDCLSINFNAGGCSGESWKVELIDSEQIKESCPVQRVLLLSLKNDELCDAWIQKEISFDITDLQIDDDKIILNIKGFDERVLYDY